MPYQYLDGTGVIVADTATVQATVIAEWQTALGADVVTTTDTPQGVLIAQEVTARSNVIQNNADVANQINPNIAGGIFLDAILALTGNQRIAAAYTTVTVEMLGIPTSIIPAGVIARTGAGDQFYSIAPVTIGSGGDAFVTFQAFTQGAIPCAANALNIIVTGAIGLNSLTNPTAGIIGGTGQSDASARSSRTAMLGAQSQSLSQSIISNLLTVPNVTDVSFVENIEDFTQTISGVSLKPKSIYVCCLGGADADIAAMLSAKKSGGVGYNGSVTVPYTDPYSGQVTNVQFDRGAAVEILVQVTVKPTNAVANLTTAIQNAILAYAAGQINGESGFKLGVDVSPYELAGAINAQYPQIFVSKILIALASDGIYTANSIAMNKNQYAAIVASDITVLTA
ncbi:Baseplate protein J-like [uncultured Caudovirales phage]|uniref:Baseplate protein J-like n=1 Tax=uncultured Caudovirales phage TaxID=2100421 RepID=A0A6J5LG71_9CAUD|nr:Baseplate protein J-like [uncultured Caudovirales phage]